MTPCRPTSLRGPCRYARLAITRQRLAAELIAAVRAEGCEAGAHYLEAEGSFALDNGQAINFEQLYGDLATAPPKRRADALEQVAKVLAHPPRLPETWEVARDQVLPVVKKRIAVAAEEAKRTLGSGSPRTFTGDLTPHLVFEMGVQSPGATFAIPAETVQRWGVTPDVAFQQAMKNLASSAAAEWGQRNDSPGVWISRWKDGLGPSRLGLPEFFTRLPLKGRPVVLAPTPQTLLVTGSEDENGLFQLGLLAKRIVDKEKLIHILRPIRLREDGRSWEDWLPPRRHAAYAPLRLLQATDEARDYVEGAAIQRKLAEGRPLPPMPPLVLLQSAMGAEVMTVTIWRAGKPTALPKADQIILVRGAETLGACAWDSVARAPGLRLEPLPGYPTRYMPTDFPEDWQLQGMDVRPWEGPLPT